MIFTGYLLKESDVDETWDRYFVILHEDKTLTISVPNKILTIYLNKINVITKLSKIPEAFNSSYKCNNFFYLSSSKHASDKINY